MKKILVLIAVVIFVWFIKLPDDMPQAQLKSYDNARLVEQGVEVGGACENDKCLVVYVAPWCPSCKSLTPMINDLISELNNEGIKATVVIGKDSMNKILDYSRRYEGPILADANGRYFNDIGANGVPYFAVSNSDGKRISEMTGGYTSVDKMRSKLDI